MSEIKKRLKAVEEMTKAEQAQRICHLAVKMEVQGLLDLSELMELAALQDIMKQRYQSLQEKGK